MKFRLIESILTEGKNIEKTWEQYKDKIIAKLKRENPLLFKDISDMPFVSDGDGYEEVTEQSEIERRAKGAWIALLANDPTMNKVGENPTTTGDYGIWLTNRYLDGQISWYNSDKVGEWLDEFRKKKPVLPKKDINQYKSVNELVKAIESVDFSDRQKERMLRNAYGDSKLLYADEDWLVYQVTSFASACTLGKGTRWCTAYSNDDSYYKAYSADGNLYVIINRKDSSEKYQLFVPENNAKNHFKVEMHDKDDSDMHGHTNYNLDVDEFLEMDKVTDGLRDFLENKADIHRVLETPDNADVLAIMDATGVTADSAQEMLEDGEAYVYPDISNDLEYGQYLIDQYGFDEAFLSFIDFELVGDFVLDNPSIDLSDSTIDLEKDSKETIGEKYFKEVTDWDFDSIEPAFDYAGLGQEDRYGHEGVYTRYGLVTFNY